jgi:hypothetical protein
LLLDDGELAFRCSYVDYDGDAALSEWRRLSPSTEIEREDFVRRMCPLIPEGIGYLGRYLAQVRAGKRPEHM